jgi:hypothetical protein
LNKLTILATNLTNGIINTLLIENYQVGIACKEIYGLLEVSNILDTLNRIKNYLSDVLLNNQPIDSETTANLIEHISEKYFYSTSEITAYLEELLLTKGIQVKY